VADGAGAAELVALPATGVDGEPLSAAVTAAATPATPRAATPATTQRRPVEVDVAESDMDAILPPPDGAVERQSERRQATSR